MNNYLRNGSNMGSQNHANHYACPRQAAPCPPVRPSLSRKQMLNYIDEVSFAVTDLVLYLDTHPCDKDALARVKEYLTLRNTALEEYAKCYGPLTIDTADDSNSDSWEWVLQPWPWEGGMC